MTAYPIRDDMASIAGGIKYILLVSSILLILYNAAMYMTSWIAHFCSTDSNYLCALDKSSSS